ncbi:hypothetical protein BBW65_06980 [Helicobacter enhydrae]|uniref:Uncharacterized protein n=1 Tax=Helicobacter enhydrae TaxID=222136 RepID=A0A1B1U774_9HELI|nr:hypothetical protein [Helicobacter enhydrae]ANV98552.1 hypothetical protein BBW65_06980 [Helicobacter enhydrae]
MKVLVKNETIIINSNLEESAPLWTQESGYKKGDVVVGEDHLLYEALNDVSGVALKDSLSWKCLGSDNTRACFDFFLNTTSKREESLKISFSGGGGLYLGNIRAKSARVEVYNSRSQELIEQKDFKLIYRNTKSWKEYFFGEFIFTKHLYYPRSTLTKSVAFTLTLENAGSIAEIGSIFCGNEVEFGTSLYAGSISASDFSKIETDEDGYTSITKGHYKKLNEFSVLIENERLDHLVNKLIGIRGEPAVFIIANTYESLINFAVLKSWEVPLELKSKSIVNLEIEGLI